MRAPCPMMYTCVPAPDTIPPVECPQDSRPCPRPACQDAAIPDGCRCHVCSETTRPVATGCNRCTRMQVCDTELNQCVPWTPPTTPRTTRLTPAPDDGSCMARDGTGLHQDGESWTDPNEPCMHRSCSSGAISEAMQDCPQPQCDNPVRVEGQVRTLLLYTCFLLQLRALYLPSLPPSPPLKAGLDITLFVPCLRPGVLRSAAGSAPTQHRPDQATRRPPPTEPFPGRAPGSSHAA